MFRASVVARMWRKVAEFNAIYIRIRMRRSRLY